MMRVYACRTSDDVCLSVAYIGPKSRTERPRKTKIGIEVAYVTRDSDTTFKVKGSKINLQGAGAYCGGLPHSLFNLPNLERLKY